MTAQVDFSVQQKEASLRWDCITNAIGILGNLILLMAL